MTTPQNKPRAGVFDEYARYYDLLYRDKDYAGEVRFVHEQLALQGGAPGALLELGCGTGRHAIELGRLGYRVTGVDLSSGMVEQAAARAAALSENERRNLSFRVGDVRSVRVEGKFDTVVSLFHVMSYQTTDDDLRAAFKTVAHHLKPGGLFLFDFWYGPAVLNDPPVVRVKRLEDEDLHVTRLAEPEQQPTQNSVIVNYDVFLKSKRTGSLSEIRESHRMRYLFLPEIQKNLIDVGMELCRSGGWNSTRPLDSSTWYGFTLANKR